MNPANLVACFGLALPVTGITAVAVAAYAVPFAADERPAPSPARIVRPVPPAARQPVARAAVEPEPYVVRRILDVPGVMKIGDTYWDEAGVPPGQIVVTVDLQAQVLSVFRGGYEIGTAAILYGGDDKPTPLGIFPITQKDADHVSNLYDAPMPYMLRLTNDGVSIHGSPTMAPGLMTHGCVGVPTAFARKLFAATKLGDKVIVTNGERLDLGKAITAA